MRFEKPFQTQWKRAAALLLMCCSVCVSGCGTRIIITDPNQNPAQLIKTIKQAAVAVRDKDGNLVPGKADLPAGSYVLPDPGPKGK